MDIKLYDIIKGPVVTSKADRINKTSNKLVLVVHKHANKPLIKEALEKLFEVKVETVRTSVRKPKKRLVNRRPVMGSYTKKAVITLKKGYSLDMYRGFEVNTVKDHAKAKVEQE